MRRFAALLVLSTVVITAVASGSDVHIRQFPANGSLKLVLHDDINLPFYSWPRTLLTYSVDFSAVKIAADHLQLLDDQTGQPAPFQLSDVRQSADGTLQFARVSFFSDLKPSATVSFELQSVAHPGGSPQDLVTEHTADQFIEIDGGALKVRIPVSQPTGGQSVPGPIVSINRGQGWIGDNRILSPHRPISSVNTQSLAAGPLFRSYAIRYEFAAGGEYTAIVKIVAGYSFVELTEQITGLTKDDGAVMEMAWTGFKPSWRYPADDFDVSSHLRWLGIDEPVITPDIEEDPKWMPANVIEDPSKDMAFELAAYSGNGVRDATPVASFWEERQNASELSLFVLDTLKWQDHQYGIWQPTTALQVHFRHDAADGLLHCTWPLVTGSRSTGIALDDAGRAQADTEKFVKLYLVHGTRFGGSHQAQDMRELRLRSGQVLRSWYGSLSLDRVKNMVLTYPQSARQPAPLSGPQEINSVEEFAARMKTSALALYPLGTNLVAMDIRHREVYDALIPAISRFRADLPETERKRAIALMLLSAYLNSGDDMAAVRICLGGTPNMCADGFSIPAEITYLFPDHPMAAQWRDQFEKTLRLMGCYYTRPDVPQWGALGGRWTESLSVYNWAYLRPTELAEYCASTGDGQNRFANPWMAQRARWLVDELTAPIYNPNPYWRQPKDPNLPPVAAPPPLSPRWKPGMPLSGDFGFDRQYPSHGAHGSGTSILVPWEARDLGQLLRRYDPMVAEHLVWAAAQAASHDGGELSPDSLWARQILGQSPQDSGTPPHLASCKYTGHGIILRAAVNTPDELSIHLDQIDAGPNYRWGDNGQGSCGVLYFYAAGRVWTGHERENTGDHYNEDTIGATNFGFMKGGKYRCIGANTLDRPLYDLGVAQFAQLTSLRGPGAYSWPQYDSRSVMLIGDDYFVLLDRTAAQPVAGSGRFSWFQANDLPFPKLIFLKPRDARVDHWSEVQTQCSRGILRDAPGSSLVLVTHKADAVEMADMTSTPISFIQSADMRRYAWKKGATVIPGVWPVKAPHSADQLFIDEQPISCKLSDGDTFTGLAGVIRHRDDGSTQMAILQGSRIGTRDLVLEVPEADQTGISAVFMQPAEVSGEYFAPHGDSSLSLHCPDFGNSSFYIDGNKQPGQISQQILLFPLAPGRHHWQLTAGLPQPMPVNVNHTEDFADGAVVFFETEPAAGSYELQLSSDGCRTWKPAGKSASSPVRIDGLASQSTVHVRIIASNARQTAGPGDAYPIDVANKPPDPPDGLYLHLAANRVEASWGQVLGVGQYRLYRRHRGEGDDAWKLLFDGPAQSYSDHDATRVVPPDDLPGPEDADQTPSAIYEYTVVAINGNGESPRSRIVSTDPAGWNVWWPPNQTEQFKRQSAYWLPPYVPANQVPPPRYPTGN